MASLRDKLRMSAPGSSPRQPARPRRDDCLVMERTYPLAYRPTALSPFLMRMLTRLDVKATIAPDKLLFFDTETTGLSGGAGTLAFLVGIGRYTDAGFQVTQFLMRDYDEEPFLIDHFMRAYAACDALVSFNGKSFDWPLLRSRATLCRKDGQLTEKPHIDLLHQARLLYKLRIGQCSLARVEESLLNFRREDDLPGAEIPAVYFRYLKTGAKALLDPIIAHNAEDVHSLAALLERVSAAYQAPDAAQADADIFSLGRAFHLRREHDLAAKCYRRLKGTALEARALPLLAAMQAKRRDDAAACAAYEYLRSRGHLSAPGYVALAILYERRLKNFAKALEVTKEGVLYCLDRPDRDRAAADNLTRRYRRLRLKEELVNGLDGRA